MKNFIKSSLTIIISVLVVTAAVKAGTITPPSGAPTAQFYTLSEIYNLIASNATTTAGSHDFTFSDALAGSGKTLTQIYDALTGLISADKVKLSTTYLGITGTLVPSGGDATTSNVLSGKTFFGNDQTSWTLQTGTMASVGQQIITASTSNLTITQGYHDGTGYCLGDSDLLSANIKSGVTIFGVDGNGNIVDTSSGDAAAGDILLGKIAWVQGTSTTGTIADCSSEGGNTCYAASGYWTSSAGNNVSGSSGSLSFSIPDGYYSSKTCSATDTDLSAGNIRSGVNIFGVNGSASTAYDYTLQAKQIYDDYNCSGNNGEGTSACAAGDPEYTGEEGTWTLANTDATATTTLASGKVYKDNRTNLYWSDYKTASIDNDWQINTTTACTVLGGDGCTDEEINGGTCDQTQYMCYDQDGDGSALTYCQALALDADGGGQETDWRLPTQKELMQAYIDGAANNLPIPVANFWSSTEYYSTTTNAWNTTLANGYTSYTTKTNTYGVRCVRP